MEPYLKVNSIQGAPAWNFDHQSEQSERAVLFKGPVAEHQTSQAWLVTVG